MPWEVAHARTATKRAIGHTEWVEENIVLLSTMEYCSKSKKQPIPLHNAKTIPQTNFGLCSLSSSRVNKADLSKEKIRKQKAKNAKLNKKWKMTERRDISIGENCTRSLISAIKVNLLQLHFARAAIQTTQCKLHKRAGVKCSFLKTTD